LSETIRIAEGFLLKVVVSSADSSTRYTPFFAFREVIVNMLSLKEKVDSLGEKAVSEVTFYSHRDLTLLQILREKLQFYNMEQYASLLNDYLPFDYEDSDITLQMNAQTRLDAMNELLLKLFKIYSEESSMVVIIDDAQWLDSHSWTLVLNICQRINKIL
jgi:hypothetical protein